MDSAALVEMFDFVRERKIPVHSVQIARDGRLALDAYFYPFEPQTRHDVASVTKSITSLLVGLAIDKGFLADVRQPLSGAFPERRSVKVDDRKNRITLEHLLCMNAGWDCGFEPKEERLFEMRSSADWLQFMLDLPMVAEPGTRWAYCSGNCHVLSMLLTQATGTNALAFARRELFGPLGISDLAWPADRAGHNHGWGDLQMRPRDMAKIGQLMLQRGRWGQQQILAEAWVTASTSPQVSRTSNNDQYGYLWWVKGAGYPGMFEAVGRGGQRITVWPARDLVVVFTGGGFEPGELAPFLLKALKSDGPLPPNRDASRELQKRLAAARQAPATKRPAKLPALARAVSGKMFEFSPNRLQLEALRLEFKKPSEKRDRLNAELQTARAELLWQGKRIIFPIGLDGIERFSMNPIVNLRQAAKGEWLDAHTFSLELDLVGGINSYRIQLGFPTASSVDVEVTERTGLNEEHFKGRSPANRQ
jgi:CubicO group peptidase (beta-lactamase class C family)